jgi:hypothetical protein
MPRSQRIGNSVPTNTPHRRAALLRIPREVLPFGKILLDLVIGLFGLYEAGKGSSITRGAFGQSDVPSPQSWLLR